MRYITAKEAAERWGISLRYVQRLLMEQRIPGARKYQRSWLVPADADKPEDLRKREKRGAPRTVYLPYRTPVPLMTQLYAVPGRMDLIAEKQQENNELAALCGCQLSYFRGEIETAQKKAGALYADASCLDTKLGALFVLSSCAVYSGAVRQWNKLEAALAGMRAASEQDQSYIAFCRAGIWSKLWDTTHFPDWLRGGCFDPLPGESYPLARFYYLKFLLLTKIRETPKSDFTAAAEPLISQTKLEGIVISEAYLRLLAAIAYHSDGNDKAALVHIERALALLLPDRLYMPLAECSRALDFLLLRALRTVDRTAYECVVSLNKRMMEGWTLLHNAVLQRNATNVWTVREREIVKLAVRGLTNKQIAERLRISVNTVKQRLGVAMEKVNVKKRKDLARFF